MAIHEPRLQTSEHPLALSGIYEVIKRFDRNTTWVATGLLSSVVFAALMVAVKERHANVDDFTAEARLATGDLLLHAEPAAISAVMGSNGKSTGDITSGEATSVDRKLTPEISHPDVQANATSRSPANWQDSGRVKELKMPHARSRSSGRLRFADVKMRLIALWHQCLAQSEKSRTWTAFSNSNKGERRKVGYTAETYR